jgi:hypothetical protein
MPIGVSQCCSARGTNRNLEPAFDRGVRDTVAALVAGALFWLKMHPVHELSSNVD